LAVLPTVTPTPTSTPRKIRLTPISAKPTLAVTPRKVRPTPPSPLVGITPTATVGKTRPTPIPPETQAGNTNGIVLFGVLIVAIIVIPIMLQNRKWRKKLVKK
jgi:hypothetical protein